MKTRASRSTVALLATAAGLVLAAIVWLTAGTRQMTLPFDQNDWRNEVLIYEAPYVRLEMVKDLTKNHLSVGQSRKQVEDMLGKATDTPYFKDHDLVYWLGSEPGFVQVDSSWLVIDFDEGGKLSKLEVVTD
jgi:hypothetical protein